MIKIIKIEGMTCEHCESSVKNALSKIPNVEVLEVSKNKKEAHVQIENVADKVLIQAIDDIGFDVIEVTNE